MKLCIVSLKKFFYKNGIYWTYGGFGEYVKSFYPYFNKIHLCVPISTDVIPGSYKMNHPKLSFTHLPYYQNELELLLRWPLILCTIKAAVRDSDIINPRIPDMTGVAGWLWACHYKKPHFISIQSDVRNFLEAPNNTRTKGIVKFGLYTWLRTYLMFERKIFQKSLCFPQGRLLFERYPSAFASYEWISSSIHDQDIVKQSSFSDNSIIKLLHVGRVTRAKGHKYLLQTISYLKTLLPDRQIKLQCIGKMEHTLKDALLHLEKQLGLENEIDWIGNIMHGKQLWSYYDNADIFVFSSIWEGTPKVLIEAMARGLPIVSTNVGGIPSIVKHNYNGLLVFPQRPEELANEIKKLILNKGLRQRCINNGLKFAKKHTIEAQTWFIIQKLKETYDLLDLK